MLNFQKQALLDRSYVKASKWN